MCDYIERAQSDPVIRLAGRFALEHFGANSTDPAMQAWAVFWFVKHNVKFVVDESPMMRLGEPGQQDLLISPSVLIRMDQPQEDCDGFTMLGGALLKSLGVPFVIATIAASPDDPSRWSHVFLLAQTPGGWLPLDISHGTGPGWMVPAAHTFRWQCWDSTGAPCDVKRPQRHTLNGYQSSGFGQFYCDPTEDPTCVTTTDPTPVTSTGAPSMDPTTFQSIFGSTPPSTSSPFNWTSFLNTLTTQAASVAKVAETPFINPTTASLAGVTAWLPIVGVGLAAWLLISSLGNKR